MRSYDAARGYFGFLEFIAWCALVGGGLLAFSGGAITSQSTSFGGANFLPMLMGAVPGLILMVIGFFSLVYVQGSRAAVDCAEYAQQALKVSRDQLDISKQILKLSQRDPASATYTGKVTEGDLQDIDFDTGAEAKSPSSTAPTEAPKSNRTSTDQAVSYPPQVYNYDGQEIAVEDGKFLVGDRSYDTLVDAKLAIDGTRLRQKTGQLTET